MGIINNLKVYMDERKKDKEERKKYRLAYELESKKLRNYKEEIRNIALAELEFEEPESEYEKEKNRLINDTDVKYYIIDYDDDDADLNRLIIMGKDGIYAEFSERHLIKPIEELDVLIANKDYRGLINSLRSAAFFAPLIEISKSEAEERMRDADADIFESYRYETTLMDAVLGPFGTQWTETEEIIDTILEEKYFAEHPESAEILMKKRKKNK